MDIIIENNQNKVEITDEIDALIKKVIELCLELENFNMECEISVSLVDNEEIRQINKEHRRFDKPTDVLSFPMLEFSEGEVNSTLGDFDLDEELLLLGDIVISMEMAELQSREYGHSFEREAAFLVSHGMFHLLGYDHMTDEDEKLMMEKQENILMQLGLKR